MSDVSTLKGLHQTLEDGREGYAKGAEKLTGSDTPELAATFTRLSAERARFAAELAGLTGPDVAGTGGSVVAAAHRGWMSLKDALTGSGPDSILGNAVRGDAHAVSEFEKALGGDELTGRTRTVVAEQLTAIRAAHAEVTALHETHKHTGH